MADKVIVGATYLRKDDKAFSVVALATHSVTGEPLVVIWNMVPEVLAVPATIFEAEYVYLAGPGEDAAVAYANR